jgi:hypothetical protein
MLKATVIAVTLGLGAVLAPAALAQTPTPAPDPHATINQRLENQGDRIQAGVKDDQLTKGQATHLKADDAAIHAEEKVDRHANDGKLTPAEQRQLNRQLNRNSRQIYRARHK